MNNVVRIAAVGLLLALARSVFAEEVSKEQIKGIDEQVQDIKTDVLEISSELNQLEEKLLYPSNTQVSVFISLGQGEEFRLDAVDIELDGKVVEHYIYAFKELQALQEGGVQRIYTGNVRSGEHRLDVTVIGKSTSNDDYRRSASHKFTKEVGPRLVEITLAGPGLGKHIKFKDW
jgi:hypothetical protein